MEDEEADVIKYKALDTVCMRYHIEEEQLKHVLYLTYILPNQHEADLDEQFDQIEEVPQYSS